MCRVPFAHHVTLGEGGSILEAGLRVGTLKPQHRSLEKGGAVCRQHTQRVPGLLCSPWPAPAPRKVWKAQPPPQPRGQPGSCLRPRNAQPLWGQVQSSAGSWPCAPPLPKPPLETAPRQSLAGWAFEAEAPQCSNHCTALPVGGSGLPLPSHQRTPFLHPTPPVLATDPPPPKGYLWSTSRRETRVLSTSFFQTFTFGGPGGASLGLVRAGEESLEGAGEVQPRCRG